MGNRSNEVVELIRSLSRWAMDAYDDLLARRIVVDDLADVAEWLQDIAAEVEARLDE